MTLHEYHARLMSQDRERSLRATAETARLHADATATPRRRRWARARRRTPEVATPPVTRPAYTLRPSPQ